MSHPTPILTTPRLRLRGWQAGDLPAFAAMNADPVVREFFPGLMTREECEAMIARVTDHFDRDGFGFWAVELLATGQFIGMVGLQNVPFESHFTPNVEIGWRIAREFWGNGYATEAAQACLDLGFQTLGLKEIVAFTVPANLRSRAVMERLGMTRNPEDDFDHPSLSKGHPLERHVLYRIRK
ncbi:GNAT family N-acetyltransferase [Planctomicrobium piriforme]|uniref:Ribosomal-protein-alanine N-acetyltransferase n=1 Tax=Planctomicrobium piriforme TaxID=1576369 RepID=A0A1I3ASH5_9PLAN|nr:GNAT family N-acetyltransferase [Planctomicrobium piriforme]SFH53025.1 ribosomal-protein-alanine N-acetyltransferase [Planctomicrobium piriforme]